MVETLADIGEFGLIPRLRELIRKHGCPARGVTLGIGDDTASFVPRPGHEILVTCDCVVEGRHYLPGQITPYDLGRRAMILNISDIGAMGGLPLYALISLGLRGDLMIGDIEEMYRGFLVELAPFDASIIGGNLTQSGDSIFIDITLIGEAPAGETVHRSGARVGDSILVTGYPGRSAAGLRLLLQGQEAGNLEDHPLVRAYRVPGHRAAAGRAIALSGHATAMIDTSDGFLGDLGHICEESGVGAVLFQEKLPLSDEMRDAALQLRVDPYEFVLGESDDYELIVTCPPEHARAVLSTLMDSTGVAVAEVGRIAPSDEGIRLAQKDGTERRLNPAGWNHFAR